jgi:hypothetical protein
MASRREIEFELRTRWAGEVVLEELRLEEMRETIRAYLRERRRSVRWLALSMEVPPRRLREFLLGAGLTAGEWARVADWCAGKHTPRVSPDKLAVGVLVRHAPRRLIPGLLGGLMVAVPILFWLAGARFPADAFDAK